MKYISTLGDQTERRFCEILLEGLAPDGGLVVPTELPKLDKATLEQWRGLSYQELSFEVISRFATDIPASDLRAIINKTYTKEAFGSDESTPLKQLDPTLYILGLSHGPRLAF